MQNKSVYSNTIKKRNQKLFYKKIKVTASHLMKPF